MKRSILSFALILLAVSGATTYAAAASASMGGIGFHNSNAPLGVRHWFTDAVAIDLGAGFSSDKREQGPATDKTTTTTLDVGVPICLKKLEKAHFIVRPGFQYFMSKDQVTGSPDVKITGTNISGELEVEYWLTDKLSLSASEGLAFGSSKDDRPVETKFTNMTSIGNNFTEVGFHVYLW